MDTSHIAQAVDAPTPRGIATGLSTLIRSGEIPAGTRLPTVRSLAAALGVSPATVSHAWQALATAGLIATRGRAGSTVLHHDAPWLTPRSLHLADRGAPGYDALIRLDLAAGIPDPNLLPDITESLARVVPPHAATSHYLQPPLLAELEAPLRARWPYQPEALTIVDGAMDGIQRALHLTTRYGDRVLVESPGFPLLLDLVAQMHLSAVPVAMDESGLRPDSLRSALETRPAALVIQPRAQNPTGVSMTAARAETLSGIIANHGNAKDTVIIEDDHSSGIALAATVSLGQWLPERTIHVQSFSKSHGPDLRIAALGGRADMVGQIVAYRVLGPGWTSRMLQAILYDLLTERTPTHVVQDARRVYHARQRTLTGELATAGIHLHQADGLNLWLPVADERDAQTQLAAHGIRVALGSPFVSTPVEDGSVAGPFTGPHVRVSIGMLRDSIPEVAAILATVAEVRDHPVDSQPKQVAD